MSANPPRGLSSRPDGAASRLFATRCCFIRLAVAAFLLTLLSAPAPAAEAGALEKLVPQLQDGGLVIYLRHAATVHEEREATEVDLERCETQRNLSAKGRSQARLIGKAFRALEIPVGQVVSSPFCRCKDTAQLAFGKYTVDHDLHFAIGVSEAERQQLTNELRRMLGSPPPKGENRILVSHTANLREAADTWPKPEGVAYIFRPRGSGQFEILGRIPPDQWSRYAIDDG